MEQPIWIDGADMRALIDFPELVDGLEAAHREPAPAVDRLLLESPDASAPPPREPDRFLLLPAWQPGRALGVKLATVFPGNLGAAGGLPSVQGLYVLFDGTDGRPLACLDGVMLTYLKTAADSALGARLLSRPDGRTLLIVGAGGLAPYLVEAHLAVRPSLARVLVWNRTPERAERLAARLRRQGLEVAIAGDLARAVGEADLISCATFAQEPLVCGAWLQPGAHLDLVGGFTPAMRETDDEAVRRGRMFVDSRWYTLGICGDLVQPMAQGVIGEDDIQGDLFELAGRTRPGRRDDAEITLFKNGGGAHLDLMTARLLLARATRGSNAQPGREE